MKKFFFFMATVTVATTTLLTACSSDDDFDYFKNADPNQLRLCVNFGSPAKTRATGNINATSIDFSTLGVYVWRENSTDTLKNFGYINRIVKSSTKVNDKQVLTTDSALYFPLDKGNVDVYLYAPYSKDAIQSNMAMQFKVADDQSKDADYKASDFICGKATATFEGKIADVQLRHALSKIIFKVSCKENVNVSLDGLKKIVLDGVQKKATINMTSLVPAVNLASDGTTYGKIVVSDKDTDKDIVSKAVEKKNVTCNGVAVILPPQIDTDFKAYVTVGDKTATADLKGKLGTLQGGKVYTVNLKVDATAITVNVTSIVDWVAGNGNGTDVDLSGWQ
jgi:hypothetical protein